MFSVTPPSLSLALLCSQNQDDVLTAVKLPMLLRVLTNRQRPLIELADLALTAGCEGIIAAGTVLRTKAEGK